jgi:hypothetical protein
MSDSSSDLEETLKSLEKTKIGKMWIEFAELSMMASGAIESLIEGVKAFGRQIEERLQAE